MTAQAMGPEDRKPEIGAGSQLLLMVMALGSIALILSVNGNSLGSMTLPGVAQAVEQAAANLQDKVHVQVSLPGVKAPKSFTKKPKVGPKPSVYAVSTIPPHYLDLCLKYGAKYKVDWRLGCSVLKTEADYGRLKLPGVTSGINGYTVNGVRRHCCRGPAQFNTEDGAGPRVTVRLPNGTSYSYKRGSTWDGDKVDGDRDGVYNIFDPDDAVPTMFRKLAGQGATSPSGWRQALWGYNHSASYADTIIKRANRFGG